jgi:putative heme-binding domain-containing protein
VRARTAWSIARYPFEGYLPVLQELLRDDSALVQRAALEVYVDRDAHLPPLELQRVVIAHLGSEDRRTAEAALKLAVSLPADAWQAVLKQAPKQSLQFQLMAARARLRRNPVQSAPDQVSIKDALAVLQQPEKGTPQLGLLALSVITDSFGGPDFQTPSAEAFAGYELNIDPASHAELADRILRSVRPLFPAGGNPVVDAELARTLAMLGDSEPGTGQRMLGAFGLQSPVASDIHYLACIAGLQPVTPAPGMTNLAEVLLWLDNKTGAPGTHPGLNWKPRVKEIAARLLQRHPAIGPTLLKHARFPEGEHAWLTDALDSAVREEARLRFFQAATNNVRFAWNPDVIDLLAEAPSEELSRRLRSLWPRIDLRDAIVQALAARPEAEDFPRLIAGLASTNPQTTAAALKALTALEDPSPGTTVNAVMRVLHRAVTRPGWTDNRQAATAWLRKHTKWTGNVAESASDPHSLELLYRPVFHWFAGEHTRAAATIAGMGEEEFKHWEKQLTEAPWSLGKPDKGRSLFQAQGCVECHAGGAGFGPGLDQLAAKLPPAALMRKVVYPHLDVAPGLGVVELTLHDGERVAGIIVSESLESLILRREAGDTLRIARAEIAQRRNTLDSIMPVGLLKGVSARVVADLHAYLGTLN